MTERLLLASTCGTSLVTSNRAARFAGSRFQKTGMVRKAVVTYDEQTTPMSNSTPYQTDATTALLDPETTARAERLLPADAHVIGEPVAVTKIPVAVISVTPRKQTWREMETLP